LPPKVADPQGGQLGMMQRTRVMLVVAATTLLLPAVPARGQGPFIYPQKGQSPQQQQQAGVNPGQPAAPPPPPPPSGPQGQVMRGAARGAAVGAVGGAIGGDAGKG